MTNPMGLRIALVFSKPTSLLIFPKNIYLISSLRKKIKFCYFQGNLITLDRRLRIFLCSGKSWNNTECLHDWIMRACYSFCKFHISICNSLLGRSVQMELETNYLCSILVLFHCSLFFNPLLPKFSLVILLTVCHTIPVMLVLRIWYWIN